MVLEKLRQFFREFIVRIAFLSFGVSPARNNAHRVSAPKSAQQVNSVTNMDSARASLELEPNNVVDAQTAFMTLDRTDASKHKQE